jgi:hypothetical protein
VSVWVEQVGYGVLVAPVRTAFRVVSALDWAAWVAAGAGADDAEQAAMAQEQALVAPTLLTWHNQQHSQQHSQQRSQQRSQRPHPWVCHVDLKVDLLVGIKTHALGFAARDAMRRTWLKDTKDAVCVQ